jgi:FkbM family methyltransferase
MSVDRSAGSLCTLLSEYIKENNLKVVPMIVDVGANDGLYQSNSRFFLEREWAGVLIEPVPRSFHNLVKSMDVFKDRITFINAALADTHGTAKIYRHPNDSDRTNDGGASLIKIPQSNLYWECLTLDAATLAHIYGDVGILSIDAEGYDFVILKRWLSTPSKPTIIITEDLTDWGQQQEKHQFMLGSGYRFWQHVSGNDVYIKL